MIIYRNSTREHVGLLLSSGAQASAVLAMLLPSLRRTWSTISIIVSLSLQTLVRVHHSSCDVDVVRKLLNRSHAPPASSCLQ